LARDQEDASTIYPVLRTLGELATLDPQLGLQRARDYLAEALQYASAYNDKRYIELILHAMGELARLEGDLERAAAIYEEGDALAIEFGLKESEERVYGWVSLAFVYWRLGKYEQGKQLFFDSLAITQNSKQHHMMLVVCLLGLAGMMATEGHATLAATLLGAIDGHKDSFLSWPPDRNEYTRILASSRAQFTENQFKKLYKEGQMLGLAEAVELVQRYRMSKKGSGAQRLDQLTKREVEVLRLVALGFSDQQVAEKLVISPRTVNAHLTSIYSKLGVNSRASATRFAVEKGLA
jgi:DNA-binding CsgD family transcriptional regulator